MTLQDQILMLKAGGVLFPSVGHRVFRCTGCDAERYLQGRLTQDIRELRPGCGMWSLLLTPQGKIEAQLLVARNGSQFDLIVDPFAGDDRMFLDALLRFRVADQIEAFAVPGSVCAVLVGERAVQTFEEDARSPESCASAYRVRFGTVPGAFLLTANLAALQQELRAKGIAEGDRDGWTFFRVWAGWPEFAADLSSALSVGDLPNDAFVSYRKGCFTGHEAAEMSASRGRPVRKFVLVESAPGERIDGVQVTSSSELPGSLRQWSLGFVRAAEWDTITPALQLRRPGDLHLLEQL